MSINVSISGETERYWNSDAYQVRINSVITPKDRGSSFVCINYKRSSKGGGTLDHRVEIHPSAFKEVIRHMVKVDTDIAIQACCDEVGALFD